MKELLIIIGFDVYLDKYFVDNNAGLKVPKKKTLRVNVVKKTA